MPWMSRIRVPPPPPPPPEPALRGLGAVTVKSAELLSVSVAPPPPRSAAVVLDKVPVGAVSYEPTLLP
ncbi:hypothetical protein [Streptomyces sp. HUCO-GS316]|uniref:hypothetical protein n=1 Tax=Streptomyces sp. HUCO-GS316 TaxID=2692198 RepID=UPI001F191188|nr:hypothetical protein [Streptomyces sp. HUCO-GS316]